MFKVLIVEDEWLIAQDLAEEISDAGYAVIGPAHNVSDALQLIDDETADGALLDVNLRNETSYPIAEALTLRGIPFTFISGYERNQLDPVFGSCAMLKKPIQVRALRTRLQEMTAPK